MRPLIYRTYAVAQMSSFAAVRYLLFVFRFCALRAQKRNTDTMARAMLPFVLSLSKGRLKDVCVRHRARPVNQGATMTTSADLPQIGFVGLGVMGRPMAANLVRAGYACTVYDINPAAMARLAGLGARPAETVAEVAEVSDIFITMVVNDAQMRAILFEPGNAAQAFGPGATVIGMSTMSRAFVQE